MTRKPPDSGSAISNDKRGEVQVADSALKRGHLKGLRISDLFALSGQDAVALDCLGSIDQAARLVIGGNLGTGALDRDKLLRLRNSVTNQASQARELQEMLDRKGEGTILRDRLAGLIDYFDEALDEIGRQLRRFQ